MFLLYNLRPRFLYKRLMTLVTRSCVVQRDTWCLTPRLRRSMVSETKTGCNCPPRYGLRHRTYVQSPSDLHAVTSNHHLVILPCLPLLPKLLNGNLCCRGSMVDYDAFVMLYVLVAHFDYHNTAIYNTSGTYAANTTGEGTSIQCGSSNVQPSMWQGD